jgi:multicomponent Na+:H+ antiporter subunit G
MSLLLNVVSVLLLLAGAFFFTAGTAGLLRFPDVYTRLHALTKADNLGLGLMASGLAVQSGSLAVAAKLLVIWLLMLLISATVCFLIAGTALHTGIAPWSSSDRR